MPDCYLGFDTSCYTTSVACFSSEGVLFDERKLLEVPKGERGLRQSEGLYQHIKQTPLLTEKLFEHILGYSVKGIGCSFSPTADKNSYMPVFLAGINTARTISAALHVPLFALNHQIGHIRAALIGNDKLMNERTFYAFHISGGTTDILLVNRTAEGKINVTKVGGSDDLHAGQMIDRVGVSLGCSFPAGPMLESLASKAHLKNLKISSSVTNLHCSFSGPETNFQRSIGKYPDSEVAFAAYDLLSRTISKMLRNIYRSYGKLPVLMCGGVSSSILFRQLLTSRMQEDLYWGESKYSSDNAVGVSAIAFDIGEYRI